MCLCVKKIPHRTPHSGVKSSRTHWDGFLNFEDNVFSRKIIPRQNPKRRRYKVDHYFKEVIRLFLRL